MRTFRLSSFEGGGVPGPMARLPTSSSSSGRPPSTHFTMGRDGGVGGLWVCTRFLF